MSKPATNINSAQYYRGWICFPFSSDEGWFTFVIMMKEIEFVLKIQQDNQKVLCSLFENPGMVNEDNQGKI